MKRKLLNKKISSVPSELIFTIDTDLGSGDDFEIPTNGVGYNYDVDWGDGNTSTSQTGNASHTYSSGGEYQIIITGTFLGFYFNNGGDKNKIKSIDQWGTVGYSTNQNFAFQGCLNLTSIADDAQWMNDIINASSMFALSGLLAIPNTVTLESLEIGQGMFNASDLITMSTGLTLASLTNGYRMFKDTDISVTPTGMTMPLLENGEEMFENTNITEMADGTVLGNLTNGQDMYRNTPFETPSTQLTLDSLVIGTAMFFSTNMSNIPSGVVLPNLTAGSSMFRNTNISEVPSGMTLASLTNGVNMFLGQTLTTSSYSQLINNIDSNNANTGVTFHGGNSNYNSSAETAHDNLTVTKSWSITDGGLV